MQSSETQATIERAPRPLSVVRDEGLVSQASWTSARLARVEDGRLLVVKTTAFCRAGHPYLCANEWIAGLLGRRCGIPVLDMALVAHPVGLAVGWPYLPNARPTPGALDRAENAPVLHDMVAFDTLIGNTNRNTSNVLVDRTGPPGSERLVLIDHDRAIVHPERPFDPGELDPDEPGCRPRDVELARRVRSRTLLDLAVKRCREACDGAAIDAIVRSTPAEWLSAADAPAIAAYLTRRRDGLADLVQGARLSSGRIAPSH